MTIKWLSDTNNPKAKRSLTRPEGLRKEVGRTISAREREGQCLQKQKNNVKQNKQNSKKRKLVGCFDVSSDALTELHSAWVSTCWWNANNIAVDSGCCNYPSEGAQEKIDRKDRRLTTGSKY